MLAKIIAEAAATRKKFEDAAKGLSEADQTKLHDAIAQLIGAKPATTNALQRIGPIAFEAARTEPDKLKRVFAKFFP